MCLIVFAWQHHPDYPLILAANRDEFHAREADAMGWWADSPAILGGRDRRAGGTWLAVSKSGRFATVTNYREDSASTGNTTANRTRGEIVTDFVTATTSGDSYLTDLDDAAYAGFSALLVDGDRMIYGSNREDAPATLKPGIYGLSNAALDTPWPKLVRTREALDNAVRDTTAPDLDALFDVIADRKPAEDAELHAPSLPFEMAKAVSAPFIVTPDYGTRCSTALIYRSDGHIEVAERRFDAGGELTGESRFVFLASAASAGSENA